MQFFSHAKWQIICVYQWVKNSSFNIFTSCGKSHLHNMENMENMLPHIFIKYTLLLGWIPFWIWIDIWWVCKYKRWYKLCDIAWRLASVLLEIAIRRWVQCGHKEMDMIRNDTQVGCDIKQCSFGTKGHCVPKWISPSPLHHHRQAWTIVTWQDKSMLFFFFLYTKFWPSHPNVAIEMETHPTRQHYPILYCSPGIVLWCCDPYIKQSSKLCLKWFIQMNRAGQLHNVVFTCC